MNIEFLSSKTGQKTCTANSIFLHSAYNPLTEAERFVNNLSLTQKDNTLIFIAPCLPYTFDLIKKKFPTSKIISIQFSEKIAEESKVWDNQWNPSCSQNLYSFLSDAINEFSVEKIDFTIWQPSIKVWKEEIIEATKIIRTLIERAISVQNTRSYFGKRWFINSVTNIALIKNVYSLNHSKNDVFITATGPSLNKHIENLKKVILPNFALSSSCCTLVENKIKPTAFVCTDAGFWAKELFFPILKSQEYSDIPICASSESNLPTKIKQERKIIPLTFNSELEKKLYELSEIVPNNARENGTVSGTLLDLLYENFEGNIYLLGLDLKNTKSTTHCKPYQRDYREEATYTRINSFPFIQEESLQLQQYKAWFNSRPAAQAKRCFIVEPAKTYFNNFSICTWDKINLNTKDTTNLISIQKTIDYKIKINRIIDFLDKQKKIIISHQDSIFNLAKKDTMISELLFYTDWKLANKADKNDSEKLSTQSITLIEKAKKIILNILKEDKLCI